MGKNILTICGAVLAILSTLLTILSFSTSKWLESYGEVNSRFVSLGLWQACFNNYGYEKDNLGRTYQGCSWIFSYDL